LVKTLGVTVRERILFGQFFPEKGSIKDQRITRDISRKIVFSKEEIAEIGLVTDDKGTRWDGTKAKEKEIELNDDEREFLKRQINRLDEEEKFTQDLMQLAERIQAL
jgi:hypothetical protein